MGSFSLPFSIPIAVILFLYAAVAFATPSLWRRGVMTRLSASVTRSFPRTRPASMMVGAGVLVQGVAFGFILSSLDVSGIVLMLPGVVLTFAELVVEGVLA